VYGGILKYTIFDIPVINTIVRWFSILFIKLVGWKAEGKVPDDHKFVMIAAPHTSNWDLPFALFLAFVLRINIYWMGKDAIFKAPFGGLFKWLGGIPIDRSKSNNVVAQSIEQFKNNDKLILMVPPSGTRKKVKYWKTGFYHIANGAGVPIVLGFLDYRRKAGGILSVFHPTGDIEADMNVIIARYEGIVGKYPEKTMSYKADTTMVNRP
jgi:1-acyl-sn-glycerol-3-phosphate acyltransferase